MKAGVRTRRLATAAIVLAVSCGFAAPASADTWTGVNVYPVNPTHDAVTTWDIAVGGAISATGVQCVKLTVDSVADFDADSAPGFAFDSGGTSALTGATLNGGTWTSDTTTARSKTWTSAAPVTLVTGALAVNFVHNPTAVDDHYLKIETFTNDDCVAGATDETVIGFVTTDNTLVTTHVDATLVFTVAGTNTACNGQEGTAGIVLADNTGSSNRVELGNINSTVGGAGAQDLSVTTNAASGAAVYVRGTHATQNMRKVSGTHNFDDSGATPPDPGTEAFGYTADDANPALGNNVFKSLTGTNARVAYSAAGDVAATCIGFQATAASDTPSGDYSATVIYTAVPTY